MAKTRAVEDKPPTSQKSVKTRIKTKQTRTAQGVMKPAKSRGSSNTLKAAKKVAEKPAGLGNSRRKLCNEEKMEALTTGHMQTTSKTKETSREQEETPMMLTSANDTNSHDDNIRCRRISSDQYLGFEEIATYQN